MILYHGSNLKIEKPIILDSKRALDFGKGFLFNAYLEQAKKWSILMTKRRETGIATVSVFEYNENNNLKTLKFAFANKKWLKFISNNRKMISESNNYDVVIGPVANDNTMPVINLYLSGEYDEDEALKRLLPQKLKNQVVFKTAESLKYLKFKEIIKYEKDIK